MALLVLAVCLLATSCGKADFLEGTVWVGSLEPLESSFKEGKVYFTTPTKCILVIDNSEVDEGQYSGQGKTIVIEWNKVYQVIGTVTGTIEGDTMNLSIGNYCDLTFKKQK